jgi:hypothetical protein
VTDQSVQITEAAITQLRELLSEPKFRGHDLYPEPERSVRDRAEILLNDFLQRLIGLGVGSFPKAKIMRELEITLHAFDDFDSEEQDQLMIHLDSPLDILSIESTDGLMDEWRYGSLEAANDP